MKKPTTKISIWKVILIIFSLFILFFFLNRFTIINLNFFAKSSKDIPDLSQPLNNEYYRIERITNSTSNEIRYDTFKNFYLLVHNGSITKLNNSGEITFNLDLDEKDIYNLPDNMVYYSQTYYVISWHGIYDLSKEKPYLEKFDLKLNNDGKMKEKEWVKQFHNLYETSEIIVWGFYKAIDRARSFPLYFKQNGKWKILYTLKNVSQIRAYGTHIKFRLNYEQDFIPDKYHKLYLLKDIQHGNAYSDGNNFDDRYDNSEYPESKLEYGKQANIETLSFTKEVYQHAPYTIMPVIFGGTAVNKLTIGNSHFTFKTKAQKGAGFNNEKLSTYFYLFEIPTKFKTKNTLSFLLYKYPSNWNSDDNEGVYVIKRKK